MILDTNRPQQWSSVDASAKRPLFYRLLHPFRSGNRGTFTWPQAVRFFASGLYFVFAAIVFELMPCSLPAHEALIASFDSSFLQIAYFMLLVGTLNSTLRASVHALKCNNAGTGKPLSNV